MELIRQEDIGEARIVATSQDGLQTVEKKHGLSPMPGAILDFVVTESGRVLVVSDKLILSDVPEKLGGRFATLDEIDIKADSWLFPLVATNLFGRSQKLEDADAVQKLAGKYLEAHVRFEAMGLWQRGLVLATVKKNWERLKALGLEEGESFWGWVRKHASNDDGDTEWDRARKRFYSYMRAADLMLRNTEDREWIGRLTMKEITDIPISKVGRCCGLIGEGVFDVSPNLRAALFDSTVNNDEMNTLLRKAKTHQDEIPECVVDKGTGEISYVDRMTREEVEAPTDGMIDAFLPDIGLFDDKPVEAPKGGPRWTYDWERSSFGYWLDGKWTPGLHVVNNNHIVSGFVDLIIANCHVRADYDAGGTT